jgi:hypothetical protein
MSPSRYVELGLCVLLLLGAIRVQVRSYRDEQHWRATQRVRDRLAQEADPEAWARRQARQAHEAALVTAELARMRRARWWGRWLGRARPTEEDAA